MHQRERILKGQISMNKGTKGEIPPKARIIQKLRSSPYQFNYPSQNCKNTILLYNEIEI